MDKVDVQGIVGDGGSPLILESAGIKSAEILLAVTDSDDANLLACLSANLISPTTKKYVRLRNPDFDRYHEALKISSPHIDAVINPEIEATKA